jgi:mannose-6-phosphate isomerase-like protein (cupin superfamily)
MHRLICAVLTGMVCVAVVGTSKTADSSNDEAIFTQLEDAKWEKMLPPLGEASPEIAILHVDPKTKATRLLIRTPVALHVPKHWHSANETHIMIKGTAAFGHGEKKVELSPGGFNYMPARMVHEAWTSAGSIVFITVDGAWDVNWVEGPPTEKNLIR